MYRAEIDVILDNIKSTLSYIDKAEFVNRLHEHMTEFKGNYLLASLSVGGGDPIRFDSLDLGCSPNYQTQTTFTLVFIYDKTFDQDKVLQNFINNLGGELLTADPRTDEVYYSTFNEPIPTDDYKLMSIELRVNGVFNKQNCIIDVC